MARRAKPWYRAQTNSWYVELNGTQQQLGKHPEDAAPPKRGKKGWNAPEAILTAFHQLMGKGRPAPKDDKISVAAICDKFLEQLCPFLDGRPTERPGERRRRLRAEGKPASVPALKDDASCTAQHFWWYDAYLQSFCKHVDSDLKRKLGLLPAVDLLPLHVTRWLAAHRTWKTGKRCAVIAIKRAFNWAVEQRLLSASPIKGAKRPMLPSRARTINAQGRKEILDVIPDEEFRLFVEAMQQSGCRPSEVARVSAANVDLRLGIWRFDEHKTLHQTGKPRIVYLTPRLIEITKNLMAKHPDGSLFRGPRSKKPFGMQGICSRFRRLRKKLPHLKDAIAYAYRHSFATDALENGVGIAQVAELLGHTSTEQVMKHYSHIRENINYMKDIASKATSGCASTAATTPAA